MSYQMNTEECKFFIKKEKISDILLEFEEYEYDDLSEIFEYQGFTIELDDDGNIDDISIEDECYLRNQMNFFLRIAPYVENNSFIQFVGEDGEHFRWWFKNGNIKEIHPTYVWENDKEEE